MTPEKRRKCKFFAVIVAAIIGTILFGLSIWVNDNINTIMIRVINSKQVLREDSESFKNWKNSSVNIYFAVTLFNLTNTEQVLNGEDPEYQEIGPYVYLQKREKESYSFENYGQHLTYREKRYFYFQPELSNGDPYTDRVFQINMIANTLYHTSNSFLGRISVNGFSMDLFNNWTAHEFMWNYEDKVLDIGNSRGGLFYGKNGTVGGNNTIHTGLNDITSFGKVIMSEGKTAIDVWSSEQANMMNGTDGSMFAPGLTRFQDLYVFAADVCRSFKMIYKKDVRAINDNRILLYQYSGAPEQGLNATMNPSNKGFCVKDALGPECPPAGLMDLSRCRMKDSRMIPLYASQPRFFKADPRVYNRIKGLKPASEDDQTVLNIHPETGYPLEATKKLQFNMYVKDPQSNYYFSHHYEKMHGDYYMPIFWIQESARADSKILNEIFTKLTDGKKKLVTINYILMAISIVIILSAFLFAIYLVFFDNSNLGKKSPVSTNSTPLSNRSSDSLDYKQVKQSGDNVKKSG